MSGGHFLYREAHLQMIVEQLEEDLRTNDIEPKYSYEECRERGIDTDESIGGRGSCPETLAFVGRMIDDLNNLYCALKSYDYYVSCDTSEETFLKDAREIYGAH